MKTKIMHSLSVIIMIAVMMSIFTGAVSADVKTGLQPPYNPPPQPPFHVLNVIEFSSVGLTQTSIPQGGSSSIYGRVKKVQCSVNLTVTLKKYYNSYSPYTVATYTDTRSPNSEGNVFLSDSKIFKSDLKFSTLSKGHYVLVIQAQESPLVPAISKTIDFYIT